MPVLPQVAPYGQAIRKISGQHPIRRPPIHEPCVDGIGSVRHPDWAEMSAVFVGGVIVFLKLKPPRAHTLQEPPVGFVAKLREVADRSLRLCDRRALAGANTSDDRLIDAIARLHGSSACCWILIIALDTHGC